MIVVVCPSPALGITHHVAALDAVLVEEVTMEEARRCR